jgi:glutamate-1-semialdehyde aminotransferase
VTARGITVRHQIWCSAACFDAHDQAVLTKAGTGASRSVQTTNADSVVGRGWS